MTMRVRFVVVAALVCRIGIAHAQFSPGDLSRAHAKLEGMSHCADCHEVGKEISGAKCLTCHTPIKKELDLKRGYHFAVSARTCVTCHKEHLGQNAQITVFERKQFDHAKTGFALTGTHSTKGCDDCHTAKYIKDPEIAKKNVKTILGLSEACVSCHEDHHKGTLGTDCKSCHTTTAWKPASNFDHSRTKFALTGKHQGVPCEKCHNEPATENISRTSILGTKSFTDCAPCHTSHHPAKFSSQSCTACHVPTGWRDVRQGRFNHDLTDFKLRGRHADVKCKQCHKPDAKAPSGKVLKMAHGNCTDCHVDHHRGEFLATYNNDCAKCHTEDGYRPSTFTLARHETTRFPLRGAHMATPCARCHNPSSEDRSVFHFASFRCEPCHKDPHGGQFSVLMGQVGCPKCHATERWDATSFDHSSTSFALVGKHTTVSCSGCHKPAARNATIQYKLAPTKCEGCHEEPHAKQFSVSGTTSCVRCHTSASWTTLVFDHETQSSFSLTGAHKKVPCGSCHKEELINGKQVLRYKPLSSKCESCHGQKELHNG